ncbi:hypothetical protein ACTA71_007620 [Dictyostelium dimigraforme]
MLYFMFIDGSCVNESIDNGATFHQLGCTTTSLWVGAECNKQQLKIIVLMDDVSCHRTPLKIVQMKVVFCHSSEGTSSKKECSTYHIYLCYDKVCEALKSYRFFGAIKKQQLHIQIDGSVLEFRKENQKRIKFRQFVFVVQKFNNNNNNNNDNRTPPDSSTLNLLSLYSSPKII